MLRVRTCLGPSKIHGIGLFANEDIKKGTVIWIFDEGYDQRLSIAFLVPSSMACHEALWRYCYINPERPKCLVICIEDARFMNFDANPSTELSSHKTSGEFDLIAARDIAIAEELTVPAESDLDYSRKMIQNA